MDLYGQVGLRTRSVTRSWDYGFSKFRSDFLFQGRKLRGAGGNQGYLMITRPRLHGLPGPSFGESSP